jgi:hypothetical protein
MILGCPMFEVWSSISVGHLNKDAAFWDQK